MTNFDFLPEIRVDITTPVIFVEKTVSVRNPIEFNVAESLHSKCYPELLSLKSLE